MVRGVLLWKPSGGARLKGTQKAAWTEGSYLHLLLGPKGWGFQKASSVRSSCFTPSKSFRRTDEPNLPLALVKTPLKGLQPVCLLFVHRAFLKTTLLQTVKPCSSSQKIRVKQSSNLKVWERGKKGSIKNPPSTFPRLELEIRIPVYIQTYIQSIHGFLKCTLLCNPLGFVLN